MKMMVLRKKSEIKLLKKSRLNKKKRNRVFIVSLDNNIKSAKNKKTKNKSSKMNSRNSKKKWIRKKRKILCHKTLIKKISRVIKAIL